MKLSHLDYFAAVLDCGSISKAAETLFISQPSLSIAVQSLEKELGHYLIKRNSRGVESTPFGQQVYEKVKNIQAELRGIQALADEMDKTVKIKVATIPASSVSLLPAVNELFQQNYGDIVVQITEKPIPSSAKNLSIDDYSFIITNIDPSQEILLSGVSKKKTLEAKRLFADQMVVYINVEHPLYRVGHRITIDELQHYPIVLPASVTAVMERTGLCDHPHLSVMYDRSSIERMVYKYPQTLGLLPQIFALDNIYIRDGFIKILPLATPPLPIVNYVFYDNTRTLSRPEQHYLDLLLQESKRVEQILNGVDNRACVADLQ